MSIIHGESIDAYHGQPSTTLSKSRLLDYQCNGAPWWKLRYVTHQISDKDTRALTLGRALDVTLTEGWPAFGRSFAVIPENAPKKPTKKQINAKTPAPETVAAVAFWQQFEGKDTISTDEHLILQDAVAAVLTSPYIGQIRECQAQVTIRRELSDEGLPGITVQARPDWINFDRRVYIDLKSTRSLETFGRDAINLGYHIQASMAGALLARERIAIDDYYLLAVEWDRGARCRRFRIPDDIVDHGWRQARKLVEEIAARHKSGDWSDHPPEDCVLEVPGYMRAKLEAA